MSEPLEIERTYLLRRLPPLPAGHVSLRIEQGYLPDGGEADAGTMEGRIRRTLKLGGEVECTHTVKKGLGLVRTEVERRISEAEFEREWPRTVGRRIAKTRHKVKEGALTWEIDAFVVPAGLMMAEVELPTADTPVTPPAWLAPHILREVTEEPEYRNFNLAKKAGLLERGTSPGG
jgi:adenylate cyclase